MSARKTAPTNRLVATGLCARLEPTTAPNEQHLVFYNHSSQWRYEKVSAQELLSPLADASKYSGHLIDFNVRAERMGWLPSAPQLGRNPLGIKAEADKAGLSPQNLPPRR